MKYESHSEAVENTIASTSAEELRSLVLQRYSSSSEGTHRPMTPEQYTKQITAYSYYLRGCLPSSPKGSWLDLGCGQGTLLRFALQQGYADVVGIDASEEMLQSAAGAGARVELADVRHWLASAPSRRFNVVSALDLLEHFPKEQGFELLRQMRRVLLPEGVCLLQMPNAVSPWSSGVLANDLTHVSAYSPASIAQLAKLAGFTNCRVTEMGPPPGTIIRQARRVLWTAVRNLYRFVNLVETGSAAGGVYTRVMLVKLWGERD